LPDYYDQSPAGNNIESVNAGRASAGDAWGSWMDSSGHRVHLLGENSFYAQQTSVGVGFVDNPGSEWRYYWVVITAPPSGPTVSIMSPKAGQELTGSSLLVSGTTDGKPAATRVDVCVENAAGTSEWIAASGTSNWSVSLDGLQPGSNTLRVRSVDSTNTVLDQALRNIRFVVLAPLTVNVSGNGTVTKGFAGITDREAGRSYRISAKSQPGSLFAGWTGSVNSPNATIEFIMAEGFTLTANFVENPFLEGRGNYAGISAPSTSSPGLLTLKLSGTGRLTGKLKLEGFVIPLRGTFSPTGHALFSTKYKGQSINIDLTYSVTEGIPSIAGVISGDGWTMPVDVGALGLPHDSSLVGRYTVVLRANPGDPALVPHGDGFGAARVNRSGTAVFAGQLADGTRFTAGGHLNRDGAFPIYVLPYAKKGVFAGSLHFRASNDVDGQFHWERPAKHDSVVFPNGFTTANIAVGARYTAPKHGEPVVRVAASTNNARLELGDGGLSVPVLQTATLSPDNSVTVTTPALPGISVDINSTTGQFSGRFLHPATGASTTFRGVVVQKENAGFGYFVANGTSGYATLAAVPEVQTE
jgi:Divergent InlB B-repeat domain/Bacterial Ig domain